MDINRDNYEAYFLDFAEGNLSSEEEEVLHRFLKFNPELAAEFQTFSLLSVNPSEIKYPGKSSLIKEFPDNTDIIKESNFDFYCIAYLEGDLNQQQILAFESFISENPEANSLYEVYKLTIQKPEVILFPGKSQVLRKNTGFRVWRLLVPLAAAAAIALFFIINPLNQSAPIEFASTEKPNKQTENIREIIKETKVPANSLPETLNVIRTKSSPVPKSTFSKDKEKDNVKLEKIATDEVKNQNEVVRIASLNLDQTIFSETSVKYDEIILQAIKSPSVNSGSLSLIELARYQFQRASGAIEEEDVLLWNLASNGLKELNKITGNDAKLLASRDDNGAISGIQFRSRYLNVTTPISRDNE